MTVTDEGASILFSLNEIEHVRLREKNKYALYNTNFIISYHSEWLYI